MSLSLVWLAGLDARAVDDRLAAASDAAVDSLVDEIAARHAERLATAPIERRSFVLRLVIVERRAVHQRDLVYDDGGWTVSPAAAHTPDVVSRWQGLAPLVRCENGDMVTQAAVHVGLCSLEGTEADLETLARLSAAASGRAVGQVYLMKGCSDRDLAKRLADVDFGEVVATLTEISAERARYFGNGAAFGRKVVIQLEVVFDGRTYVSQTVTDGEQTIVHNGPVEPPTATITFPRGVDFARIATGEQTLVGAVAAQKATLSGELSIFAQLDSSAR
ncbi:MAG TPA: hypothetical protein VIB48_20065 [Acidimicrobiia bacterium]|jgi:hypothetical protein